MHVQLTPQEAFKFYRRRLNLTLVMVQQVLNEKYHIKISVASLARFEDPHKDLTVPARTYIALCDLYHIDIDEFSADWLQRFM